MTLKSAEPPAPQVVYETSLKVRKSTEALALAVYDRNGGNTLTAVLEKESSK